MDASSIQFQALVTFLVPYAMQLAKRSQSAVWAWIDQNKPKVCIVTSALTALATAAGIQVVRAAHSITITWPDGATIARGVVVLFVSAIVQMGLQHSLYDGFWKFVVKSPSNAAPAVPVSRAPKP